MLEFQQFNAMWDRKMKEYEERAGELLEAMRQRHLLDAQEFKKRGAEGLRRPKYSSELLDLREHDAHSLPPRPAAMHHHTPSDLPRWLH